MKEFFSQVWCRLLRIFSDCDLDLITAAYLLERFHQDQNGFEPALVGFSHKYEDGGWYHDAVTYLAATGRFHHLGLGITIKHQRLIATYRGYIMADAVRRAFHLTIPEFKYLFEPAGYARLPTPKMIAARVEQFATDRRIRT